MLLSTLKKAKANGVPTTYVNGRYITQGEEIKKNNKLIVFEQTIDELHDHTPAIFETTVAYDEQPGIYHMRRVETLIAEGYAIFTHIEEPVAVVYKLSNSRDNILTDYQLVAASIFGLDDAKPFAKENKGGYHVSNNSEWKNFLVVMTRAGYIDREKIATLQEITVSAF